MTGRTRMVPFPSGVPEIRTDAARTVRSRCAATQDGLLIPLRQLRAVLDFSTCRIAIYAIPAAGVPLENIGLLNSRTS